MKFTKEKEEILNIDFSSKEKNIILIEALSGTGKTTTLIDIINKKYDLNFLYLSFNNEIVYEMKERIKKKGIKNTEIHTVHSFTKKSIYKLLNNNIDIKNDIEYKDIKNILQKDTFNDIPFLYNLFKQYLKNTYSDDYFFSHNDIEDSVKQDILYLYEYFEQNKSDFLFHDIYLKIFFNNIEKQLKFFQKYDVILIDEAQDLNPIMFKILEFIMDNNINVVCVGDRNQSINSFLNNINLFCEIEKKEKYSSRIIKKKLSNSFRFKKNSKIEILSNYILNLRELNIKGASNNSKNISNTHIYISRTNFKIFLKMIDFSNSNKQFNIVGCNSFYDFFDIELINDFYYFINDKIENINNEYIKFCYQKYKNKNSKERIKIFKKKLKENSDNELLSNFKIAEKIDNYKQKPQNFLDNLNKSFNNKNKNKIPLFGSIHKTKGKEYDKVTILDSVIFSKSILFIFNNAKYKNFNKVIKYKNIEYEELKLNENNNINLYEELNLLYVAITRAKIDIAFEDYKYFEMLSFLKELNSNNYITMKYNEKNYYLFKLKKLLKKRDENKEKFKYYAIKEEEVEIFIKLANNKIVA